MQRTDMPSRSACVTSQQHKIQSQIAWYIIKWRIPAFPLFVHFIDWIHDKTCIKMKLKRGPSSSSSSDEIKNVNCIDDVEWGVCLLLANQLGRLFGGHWRSVVAEIKWPLWCFCSWYKGDVGNVGKIIVCGWCTAKWLKSSCKVFTIVAHDPIGTWCTITTGEWQVS